ARGRSSIAGRASSRRWRTRMPELPAPERPVSPANDHAAPADPGLEALVTLLHFHGVAADREQIRHRLGTARIGAAEMLRCAKDLGLKARACRTKWSRLGRTPLPAVAGLHAAPLLLLPTPPEHNAPL